MCTFRLRRLFITPWMFALHPVSLPSHLFCFSQLEIGRERVPLVPSGLLLPAASALPTTSCSWSRVWRPPAAKHRQWQHFPGVDVTTAFAEHSEILLSSQSCQSMPYLEQSELERWLVNLAAFLEKKVYRSASKGGILLENGYNGIHT